MIFSLVIMIDYIDNGKDEVMVRFDLQADLADVIEERAAADGVSVEEWIKRSILEYFC